MPYNLGWRGLLTLIHNKYAFPRNVTKIRTLASISPYLQIIKIHSHLLLPWLIMHIYMPSHLEDIGLIPRIQTAITNQISAYPNYTYIMCGDFNRDIALNGSQNNNINILPQEENIQWKNFTNSLNLVYIPTNTTFSKRGGYN